MRTAWGVRRPGRCRYGPGVLLVPVLPLAACGGGPGELPGAVVRDSAGVTVVEHGPVDYGTLPAWRLAPAPEVSVGVLEGDEAYQLDGVLDARRLRDGSLAVVDRRGLLRRFDPAGAHRWTAGREGDGPGEYRYAPMVREVGGDSLATWDVAANRWSVFTREGAFVRAATADGLERPSAPLGLAGPGRLLVDARLLERTRIGGHAAGRMWADLHLVDADGEVVGELGRHLYATQFQEVDEDGAFSPAVFAASAVVAPAPGGAWYGDPSAYEIRLLEEPGRTRRIVRWQGPDRSFTEGDVAAAVEVWTAGPDMAPGTRRRIEAYGETHPRADGYAAYEELLVDDGGRLWLRDFVRPHEDDGLRRWTVLSADGTRFLARMTHPEAVRLHHVVGERAVVVETDELGVERVRVYRIVGDPPGGTDTILF